MKLALILAFGLTLIAGAVSVTGQLVEAAAASFAIADQPR